MSSPPSVNDGAELGLPVGALVGAAELRLVASSASSPQSASPSHCSSKGAQDVSLSHGTPGASQSKKAGEEDGEPVGAVVVGDIVVGAAGGVDIGTRVGDKEQSLMAPSLPSGQSRSPSQACRPRRHAPMSSHTTPPLQKNSVGPVVGTAVDEAGQMALSSSPSLQSSSPSHSAYASFDVHRPLVHRNLPSAASAHAGAEEGFELGWLFEAAVGTVVGGTVVPGESVGAAMGGLVERQMLSISSEPWVQSDSPLHTRVASMHIPCEQWYSPSPAALQVGNSVGVDVGTELTGPSVGTDVGAVDGEEVDSAAVGPAVGAAEHALIALSLLSPQSCKKGSGIPR